MRKRSTNINLLTVLALAFAFALASVACSDDTEPGQDSKVTDKDGGGDVTVKPDAAPPARKVIILHTNDLHDHLQGWSPNADYTPDTTGDDKTVGGYSRLAATIAAQKKAADKIPVLTLDAGDYSMGTLFSWLNTSEVPTMALMQKMGYDVITLGNHEFDWTPDGLAQILDAAVKKGFTVPIVQSNMKFDATKTGDDKLEAVVKTGVVKTKFVKSLANGLKVGFFGIIGKGAVSVAPAASPVTFEAAKTAAAKMVTELRDTDKVDLVVAISHGGVSDDGTKGDDWQMAYDVAGIDVIVSGHTHTKLSTPVKVKNKTTKRETIIVQAGSYGKYLGKLELSVQGKNITVDKYSLVAIDDTITGDAAIQTAIKAYIAGIDSELSGAGSALTYKGPVVESAFDLSFPAFQETILGNMITDAYRAVLTAAYPLEPVAVAIESGGVIRDAVLKGSTGKLWFADVYRALPLGLGGDKKPGYPLVTFYLTGKELKNGMELLYLGKHIYKTADYYLQVSGAQVTYDSKGTLFNTVTSIKMGTPPTDIDMKACDWKTETCKCYKVATNLYVGLQLATVATATSGALKVIAKTEDCKTEIADMSTRVVKVGGKELKAWQALVTAMSKYPDTDSDKIPDVPTSYSKLQGRITEK